MKPIKRLLIANRGEIACRIIRSCQLLGIESVAVFSDADRDEKHVREADRAVYIGTSAAAESYLNAEVLIGVALKTKVDAIHPGYGFLSESTELIRRCQERNITFIGPSIESIAQMGSKINAKHIAHGLHIATVPGYNGESQGVKELLAQARRIGFPLLIKASAGGGGKGMRIVHIEDEFEGALAQAKQEALNAFGDDSVLLEKYIVRSRHIEVQVVGDSQGNVCHLFDRECSIQRNYQKLIEEAPAGNLSADTRQALFDCAVKLAQYLNYQGVGTVEFIVDADTGDFYFLEMNTRLQVEHPTTELVTGVDLVALQIQIAQGGALPFIQDDLSVKGHAIEARINAEDPGNSYLPEIGKLDLYREPIAAGLRVDSGVTQGSSISPFYDSMVAKVIAWGETRGLAGQRLLQGLGDFAIAGVKTNREFLMALLACPTFHQVLTTQYIDEVFPDGWQPWGEEVHLAIAAVALATEQETKVTGAFSGTPWQRLSNWRLTTGAGIPAVTRLYLRQGDSTSTIQLVGGSGQYVVTLVKEEQISEFNILLNLNKTRSQVEVSGSRSMLDIAINGSQVHLSSSKLNRSYQFLSLEEHLLKEASAHTDSSSVIRAQMPGLITDVLVCEGDAVQQGDIALAIESMKLVNNIVAPCSGTVSKVFCVAGDNVEGGTLLVEIESLTD
ncbi:MAG: hypothetical protein DRQ97_01475 [Gammaproteobacteria bacterium]|nr:MAG: hypothetical protein DRQ97_01475 [Gammaproteobacteria bacterium]